MMRKFNLRLAVLITVLGFSVSSYGLFIGPDWAGQPGSTSQVWTFDSPANPANPTVANNPFDAPVATVTGSPVFTWWIYNDRGHDGVWKTDGNVKLHVPNTDNTAPNSYKKVVVQMTYDAGVDQTGAPVDAWLRYAANNQGPTTGIAPEMSQDLQDGYRYSIWKFTIAPNPTEEDIFVLPFYCNLYVDAIQVDTICVPEPATMGFLGLGSLVALFLRKKKNS